MLYLLLRLFSRHHLPPFGSVCAHEHCDVKTCGWHDVEVHFSFLQRDTNVPWIFNSGVTGTQQLFLTSRRTHSTKWMPVLRFASSRYDWTIFVNCCSPESKGLFSQSTCTPCCFNCNCQICVGKAVRLTLVWSDRFKFCTFKYPVGARFSLPVDTGPGAHTVDTGSLPRR